MSTSRLGSLFQQNAPDCPACLHTQGERNKLSFYSVAHTAIEPPITFRLIVGVCGVCSAVVPFGYKGQPSSTSACRNYLGVCAHCNRPQAEHNL
jgi:hypothetical protein